MVAVSRFQVAIAVIFLSFWYIIFVLMRNIRQPSFEPDSSGDVKHLIEEIRLLKKLVDFETNQLEGLKKKFEAHEEERRNLHLRDHLSRFSSVSARSWSQPIPVLVFACNREGAVRNHVQKLIKYRPNKDKFPIIVTQDCDNEPVRKAVEEFGDEVQYIKHLSGEKANITIPFNHVMYTAYYRIARHYKLALEYVFQKQGYTSVIITEDDLDISPDFFEYFSATRYLLETDPLLWCVSAWNDNGKVGNINETAYETLYRSDFFSGLGWMMPGKVWKELGPIWPTGFWDDWMRDPARRKGRQCIRPEISRTGMTMEGKVGASKGQFFTKHLAKITVNKTPVKFTQMNLDYLFQSKYDPAFEELVFKKSPLMDIKDVATFTANPANRGKTIRVEYTGNVDYIQKADKLMIMHDFKAGVPRTAYKGVVTCFLNGVRVYLAPDRRLVQGYDPTWEVPSRFGE